MRFRTHIVFGVFLFFVLGFYVDYSKPLIILILVLLMSIMPDIDLHTSYIGKQIKIFSYLFEVVLKHRGILHSLWICFIIWLVLDTFGFGIAIVGYLGHLFLDMFNKKGLRLIWPFLKIRGPFVTGRLFDNLIFYCLLGIDLFLVLILYS